MRQGCERSAWMGILLSLTAAGGVSTAHAQPASPRVTIDLSAGLPGEGHWLYIRDSDQATYASPTFNDTAWTPVGVPHGANMLTTFLNQESGGGDGNLNGSNNWYRMHFRLSSAYANSKVMVELEG